jgi:hypothetical protein
MAPEKNTRNRWPRLVIGTLLVGGFLWGGHALTQVRQEPDADRSTREELAALTHGVPVDADAWAELDKVTKAMALDQTVEITGRVRVYEDQNDSLVLTEDDPLSYAIHGRSDYDLRMGPVEMIANGKHWLRIDHEEQKLAYYPQKKAKKNSAFVISPAMIHELVDRSKAQVVVAAVGDLRVITLAGLGVGDLQHYHIFYDPSTYEVKKLAMDMTSLDFGGGEEEGENVSDATAKKGQEVMEGSSLRMNWYRVELDYAQIQRKPKGEPFHPEDRFIREVDGHVQLQPEYAEYGLEGQ